MDKMQELFEKIVNITFQAQAQGEIGMVTGDRIGKVVAEYEEYCNQQEREKLVLEAKDQVDSLYKKLLGKVSGGSLENIKRIDDYLSEIKKYN